MTFSTDEGFRVWIYNNVRIYDIYIFILFVWQVSRNFQASLHHLHLLHVNRSWSWSWKVDPRLTLSSDILQTTAWVLWTNLRVAKHLLSRWIWMILKVLGQILLSNSPLQKTCHPLPLPNLFVFFTILLTLTTHHTSDPINRANRIPAPPDVAHPHGVIVTHPLQQTSGEAAVGKLNPQKWQQKTHQQSKVTAFCSFRSQNTLFFC